MASVIADALASRDQPLALAALDSFRRLALGAGVGSAAARRCLTAAFRTGFARGWGGPWPPRSPRALAEGVLAGGLPVAAGGASGPLPGHNAPTAGAR